MPEYSYLDDRDNSVHVVVQRMIEPHVLFSKDGYELKRIFEIPHYLIDTKWNPDDPKDFIKKSHARGGTLDDLISKSIELSEQRTQKYGTDPIKEKAYKKYSEIRGGKIHLQQKKEKLKEALKGNKFVELA